MKYFLIFLIPSLILNATEIKEKKCNFLCKSVFSFCFSLTLDKKIREISLKNDSDLKEEISRYFEPLGRRSTGFYLSGSLFFISIFKNDGRMEKLAFELFEANLLSDFSVNIMQKGFGRERPKKSEDDPYRFFSGGNSFPSSHSLHSWAMANTLSLYYPEYKIIFYAIPFLVSLSRVLDDYHWASDTVSGAIIGIISSNLIHRLNQKYSNFLFYPIVNKRERAIALRIYF